MAEAAQDTFTWQDILDFERARPGSAIPKQLAVRARFGLSPARYYQLLNRLIDRPEALTYDPMLVQRLRRLRDAKRATRFARGLGRER
jgi:Protein of unknown function (DUF3263)